MIDAREGLDINALFEELKAAATEENDSPLAAIYHIQCLETEIRILEARVNSMVTAK